MQGHNWQAIVAENSSLVWQTAYRLLGNHTDAADCFQETFLAALELSRREPLHNVTGLLVRLATTRAIDRLRQRSRQGRQQAGAENNQDTSGPDDPAGHAQTQELVGRLREAIGRLPEQEARVFCLRYLNEMSYRQIARELRIGINAVGVALYRAKARLRRDLDAPEAQETHVQRRPARADLEQGAL
ncbi:MAG: sigma-70 family RNA polymerase sigma factor [Planctomycetes bacterium]|nr:sigma-70 family RNA polymerase sigma factor [Planctomycetota bacterium]